MRQKRTIEIKIDMLKATKAIVVVVIAIFFVRMFLMIRYAQATTPNPGHPWAEIGDGLFAVDATSLTALRTFTFPNSDATILTTAATVTVAQGGTGASSFGQGWIYSAGGTGALIASTSPSVNFITATSTTASSTFAYSVNLTGGCYAVNGSCLPTSQGLTSIGPAGQTQTGPAITFATSSTAFNGLTASTTITAAGNIITFANTLAGLLTAGGGGTGISNPTAAGVLVGSYAGGSYQQLATSSLGLLTTNVAEGSNLYYTDTRVNTYINGSTTIPKTYTANSFSGAQTFTGGVTVGSLNGPLDARNGVVGATSSVGVLYGGTGLTSAPTYGQLLIGNASNGYTLSATSTLGVSLSDTTGTLAVNRGGTNITNPSAAGVLLGSYAGGSYQQLATSSLGLLTTNVAEGSNLYYLDSRVQSFVHGSTTIPKTYTANSFSGAQTFTGGVTVGSLNGPADFRNGLLGATTTISSLYGGTGISNPSAAGVLLGSYAGGSFQQLATSSLGLLTTNVAEGSNLYYLDSRVQSFVHASTTIPKTYTANTFTLGQTFNGGVTVGSLNGPADFRNGTLGATTSVGVLYGGTGITNPSAAGILVGSYAGGSYQQLATSSLGLLTTNVAEGSNLYYLDSRVQSFVHGSTTIPKTYTANTFTNTNIFNGNVGIGTSSPYAPLSVAGQIVGAYFTGTTTATSTFGGGLQANLLNITSTTATSSFGNGINLANGCFAIAGTCLSSSVGSGLTLIGPVGQTQSGPTITLATSSTAFNGLTASTTITATTNTITFANTLAGLLTAGGGGTGISNPSAAGILLGSYAGGSYQQLATSSLGLLTTNVAEGTNLYYLDSRVQSFVHASTTIPKTYTNNTFSGLQTFNGGVTIGTLNGPADFRNGTLGATTSVGVLYGGTGLTSAPTLGQILVGNSSNGYTLSATSTFGIALFDTTGTLAVNRGGTNITNPSAAGILLGSYAGGSYQQLATSSLGLLTTNVAEGSNLYYTDARVNSYIDASTTIPKLYTANIFSGNQTFNGNVTFGTLNGPLQANNGIVSATSSIGVLYGGTGWANIQANSILLGNGTGKLATTSAGTDGFVLALVSGVPTWQATSTLSTISGTLAVGKGGTGLTSYTPGDLIFASSANTLTTLASSTGGSLLQIDFTTGRPRYVATSTLGVALSDTTGTLAVNRGGTNITIPSAAGILLGSYAGSSYQQLATSSLGLLTTNVAEGSNLYYLDTRVQSFVHASTTIPKTYTANTFTLGQTFNGGVTIGSLNGPADFRNGTLGATTSVGVLYGGTGLTTLAAGDILYAQNSSSFSRLASSTGGSLLSISQSTGYPVYIATSTLGISLTDTTGTLAVNHGGTGQTTFSSGQLLYGVGSGALQSVSTSSASCSSGISCSSFTVVGSVSPTITNTGVLSLAQTSGSAQTGAITLGTTSQTTNGQTIGLNITNTSGAFTFAPTISGTLASGGGGTGISSVTAAGVLVGNYAGTGWQQLATSSLGLLTTNVAEGSNLYYLDSRVQSFVHASTTIPKTYTANTFSNTNVFNGGVTIGSLNGPLDARNGVVGATSSVGVLYGGTGLTTAPTLGQILVGNSSSGYTLSATSTFGIALSDTTGTLAVNRGGTNITNPSAAGVLLGSYAGGSYQQLATSSLGLLTTNVAEGSNLYYTDVRVNSYINGSTTIPKTYTANTFTAANNFTSTLALGSTTPFGILAVNNTGGSNAFVIGSSSATSFIVDQNGNVGIATTSPWTTLSVSGNTDAQKYYLAGQLLAQATSTNTFYLAGSIPTAASVSGTNNIFLGSSAGQANTSGSFNEFIGSSAGASNTTGADNIFIGDASGSLHQTGNNNILIGSGAGLFNVSGTALSALGFDALELTTGASSTALGYKAGITNSTGNFNTYLGYQADASANNLSNATAIGANAIVGASNSLVLGGTGANAVNVGIGTSTPYAALSVVGQIVGAYYTGTTTATSTLAGGLQTNLLNVTSTTASSTFGNGINLTNGCFAIGGTCLSSGSSGLTAIGPAGQTQTGPTITLATSSTAFNGLTASTTITATTNTITFANTLAGLLTAGGGGTGISSPSAAGILLGSYAGGSYQQLATSSLGLLTTNVAEGSNLYYTDARVNSYINASTTIPKTYTANTFTAANNFTSTLALGSTTPFGILAINNTAGSNAFVIGSSTATSFIVDQNGNIGIGTTSPKATLSFNASTATTAGLNFGDDLYAYRGGVGQLNVFNPANASTYLDIKSSGSGNNSGIILSSGAGNAYIYTDFGNDLIVNALGGSEFFRVAAYTKAGSVGISSSTPWASLAVNPVSGQNANQFVVGSSSATSFLINNAGNVGIGTTSPYAALSVVGQIVGAYFTGTTTATSTLAGGLQTNLLNVTSTTASSTFGNGINLTNGCFAIGGTCLSSGSSGLTAIGPAGQTQTGPTITLATSSTAFNGLTASTTITATTNTITFANTLAGLLTAGGGGTGISNPTAAGVLLGSYAGGSYQQLATSSLGLLTTNVAEGSNLYYLDSRVQAFVHASTTIPKTYTNNTYSGLQTFNGGVTIGSLNGPLDARNGVVGATSSVGVLYGGTGLTTVAAGDILYAQNPTTFSRLATSTGGSLLSVSQSTGYPTYIATSTLNVAFSDTTGTVPVNRGGTNITSYAAGDLIYAQNSATLSRLASTTGGSLLSISQTTGYPVYVGTSTLNVALSDTTGTLAVNRGGTNITNPSAAGVLLGSYAGGSYQQLATSSLGLLTTNVAEGSNLYYTDARVQAFVHASTTIPKTYTANNFTSTLALGSTTPFGVFSVNPTGGQASNEFVVGSSSATAFIINNNGNVGIGGTTTAAQVLSVIGNGYFTGGLGVGVATTTAGVLQTSGNAYHAGVVIATGAGTSTFNGIQGTYLNLTGTTATSTFANGISIANGCYAIGSTCIGNGLTSIGPANQLQTGPTITFATSSTAFNGLTASTTITATTNTITFANTLAGLLTAGGGGTGISNPSAAGVLLGSYAGGSYQQLATSSLGLLTTNVAEGSNLYYTDARVQAFVHASTTIPKTYTSNTFTAANNFTSTLALGSTTPFGVLAVNPTGGLASNEFVVGSSSATAFIINNNGNVGIGGTTTAAQALSVIGNGYFTGGFGVGVATTTAGVIQNTGNAYHGGLVISTGAGTSTFSGGLQTNLLNVTSGSASSTFANGINLTAGCFSVNNSCVGNVTGGSPNGNDGDVQLKSGSSFLGDALLHFDTTNKFLGIGTSSPYAALSVVGQIVGAYYTGTTTATSTLAGGLQTNLLNVTSTSASSTFANGIILTSGCIQINGSCSSGGSGTVNSGVFGQLAFYGANDTAVSGTTTIVVGTTTADANNIGIGTTSPWATLSVNAAAGATSFAIGSSSATSFLVDQFGNVGIGTTTPNATLALASNTTFSEAGGGFTALGSTTAGIVTPTDISVQGQYAYVADSGSSNALHIIDVSNPSFPTVVGSTTIGVPLRSVQVVGRYAYVTTVSSFQIIDVGNPSNPYAVGSTTAGITTIKGNFVVAGKYAYIDDNNGLDIFDVSNPTSPTRVASLSSNLVSATGIYIQGNYAYIASKGNSDLVIVDISNPSSPVEVSAHGITGITSLYSIVVSGRYAYITDTTGVFAVVDVSNPANTFIASSTTAGLSTITGNNQVRTVAISGKYVFVVTNGNSTVTEFNVSSSTNPITVGSFTASPTPFSSVVVSGRYLYTLLSSKAFAIYDLGGADINSATIHSLAVGSLQVQNNLTAQGSLQVNGSVNIGQGGLNSNGSGNFSIFATTSLSSVSALTAAVTDSNNSGTSDILTISHQASSTASNNIAAGLLFANEDNSGSATSTSRILSILTNTSTTSPTSALAFYNKNTTGALTEFMRIDQNGNVGVGTTSPFSTLSVTKSSSSANTSLFAVASSTNATLFNVLGNGNVGIGTTSPQAKLSVGGNINTTGVYQMNNITILDYNSTLQNLHIGEGAGTSNTGNNKNTYVGYFAGNGSDGLNNVYVGYSAGAINSTGSQGTYIGKSAGSGITGADNDTLIGYNTGATLTTGQYDLFLGAGVDASANNLNSSIGLGYNTQVTASNQLVIGSSDANGSITDSYFGQGVTAVSPAGITINASGGSGSNNAGASLTIAGGKGTGTATGGSIIFSTSNVLGTGATLQSLTEKARLTATGNFGIGSSTPATRLGLAGNAYLDSNVITISSSSAASLLLSFQSKATTTILNAVDNAFSFATSSTNVPIFSISTRSSPVGLIGIGTSSPWGKLSIEMGTFNPAFVVSNTGSSTPSFIVTGVNQNGAIGIATTSPYKSAALAIGLSSTTPGLVIGVNGSTTPALIVSSANGNGTVGIASSTPNASYAFVAGGSTYIGTGATNSLVLHVGTIGMPVSATTTINNTINGWSISTTTTNTAGENPVISVSSNSSTSTVGFFVSTSTGLVSGTGLGLPSTMKNQLIVGNGKVQANLLVVNGGLCVDTDGWCTASSSGIISANVAVQVGHSDLAEIYDSIETLEPGELVAPAGQGMIHKAQASAQDVMGVVSTAPGLILGQTSDSVFGPHTYPIALTGRVPVKVSLENGPIHAGDYLAPALLDGYAAKATNSGVSIGQALEDYNGPDKGTVLMMMRVGYFSAKTNQDGIKGLTLTQASTMGTALLAELTSSQPTVAATSTHTKITADQLAAALEVVSPNVITQGLVVDSISAVDKEINFKSDTVFFGRPFFTTDTAGFAKVSQGHTRVDVTFDRDYIEQPIVNTSLSFDDASSTNPELAIFSNNIQYVITKKSTKGFTIVLNKAAPEDLNFSWTAFAVKNAKVFTSKADAVTPITQPQTQPVTQPSIPDQTASVITGVPTASATTTPPDTNTSTSTSSGQATTTPSTDPGSTLPQATTTPSTPVIITDVPPTEPTTTPQNSSDSTTSPTTDSTPTP
jgi:hypothetical protein